MDLHVFIVDNDKNAAHSLQEAVRRHWAAVSVACIAPSQLMDALAHAAEAYVFVRADIPGVDFRGLTEKAHRFLSSVQVIWTGGDDMACAVEGVNAGADGYLVLPGTPERLDQIRACVAARSALERQAEDACAPGR